MSNRDRELTAERIISEYHPRWSDMSMAERDSAITRISVAIGITRAEALKRVSNPPCPQCGSSDLERGGGPDRDNVDICRTCSCISREGVRVDA